MPAPRDWGYLMQASGPPGTSCLYSVQVPALGACGEWSRVSTKGVGLFGLWAGKRVPEHVIPVACAAGPGGACSRGSGTHATPCGQHVRRPGNMACGWSTGGRWPVG